MTEVKIEKSEFDCGNLIIRNVTDNIIYALFNSRNTLKGAHNMSSKTYLENRNAVIKILRDFELEYLAEGEDIVEEQVISALVIGGDYCRNRKYDGKIVRVDQRLSDLAVEDFRKATGIHVIKYNFKNSDSIRAIKDIEIISIDRIIERIKYIPEINKKKPDFNSMAEYRNYLVNLLIFNKKQSAGMKMHLISHRYLT